jgi:hypothetical protein
MQGIFRVALLALLAAAMTPLVASATKQRGKLEQVQNAYAASIRWGDFENAWSAVDPGYREAHPMTELEFERYQQVQISGYRDTSTGVEPDQTIFRIIELRVINKHTMAERTMRYRERWRWDPEAKRWWLVVGLPDLWAGE